MAKRPRMGRNLDALLGGAARERSGKSTSQPIGTETDNAESAADPLLASRTEGNEPAPSPSHASVAHPDPEHGAHGEKLIMLGVEKIRRGTYQPRRLFDQSLLQELADSIQAQGMIQPIIVRTFADGYELVAGERRWRAAQMAGIDRVPAIVREMQDQSVAAVSLIENIQRKDLNPLEEAAAFERLCDEFGMTHKAVAESVGRSRASVTNLMRLLELNEEVKLMIDRGELEMGHARALLGAPKDQQFDVALKIVKQGMSVRAVEKYIKSLNTDAGEPAGSADSPVDDPDIERLSQKLSETLGAKVHIQHRSNGGGKLQISYSSVSELQGILAHIK